MRYRNRDRFNMVYSHREVIIDRVLDAILCRKKYARQVKIRKTRRFERTFEETSNTDYLKRVIVNRATTNRYN